MKRILKRIQYVQEGMSRRRNERVHTEATKGVTDQTDAGLVRVHAGKEWMIPGTYADRGDKYVEKDGKWATDVEKSKGAVQ
jgi:hypothetical protein